MSKGTQARRAKRHRHKQITKLLRKQSNKAKSSDKAKPIKVNVNKIVRGCLEDLVNQCAMNAETAVEEVTVTTEMSDSPIRVRLPLPDFPEFLPSQ